MQKKKVFSFKQGDGTSKNKFIIARNALLIIAVVTFIIALYCICKSFFYTQHSGWREYVMYGYALMVLGSLCVLGCNQKYNIDFETVSFSNFHFFVIYCPVLLTLYILIITLEFILYGYYFLLFLGISEDLIITLKNRILSNDIIGMILWIWLLCQIIYLVVWIAPKLYDKEQYKELDLMKLDFCSTVAILPLTIIWVIYSIETVKAGFAIIMGAFMIIQLWIKYDMIILKEDADS